MIVRGRHGGGTRWPEVAAAAPPKRMLETKPSGGGERRDGVAGASESQRGVMRLWAGRSMGNMNAMVMHAMDQPAATAHGSRRRNVGAKAVPRRHTRTPVGEFQPVRCATAPGTIGSTSTGPQRRARRVRTMFSSGGCPTGSEGSAPVRKRRAWH